MVLVEELRHVHNQIADNRQTWQWTQLNRLFQIANVGQTSQAVFTVDVHAIRTTNAFAARTTERQAVVFGFQFHQSIQQFHIGWLKFQLVVLHVPLFIPVRVEAHHLKFKQFHEVFLNFY